MVRQFLSGGPPRPLGMFLEPRGGIVLPSSLPVVAFEELSKYRGPHSMPLEVFERLSGSTWAPDPCGPRVAPQVQDQPFLCLIRWFIDSIIPALTAAMMSTAASNSSSAIPAFLASARRRSTHGSQFRVIATASPRSIFSRSVKQVML